ncbi:VOC family protein [Nonomuraea basaltis]|uniref:VOC family protein n=1 Tax=Nonomuraea basaltis TaxID=2495887 RepID=UPI00110C5332|nr:VOC family protein [Nonomuraea basaltis]TMR96786.1 extradiol dioxygenase [Nonomuraea basaltis]
MINGAHLIIYSRDADADRAFIRDVLGYPYAEVGGGWLIFKLPPAEVAVHPTDGADIHELYLMCDDLERTMDELRAKGVEFAAPVSDQGWGLLTAIMLPGGGRLGLYEPRHETAYDLS